MPVFFLSYTKQLPGNTFAAVDDILRLDGNNIGGGHSLLAIPVYDFATFPGPYNGQLAFAPTLLAGKRWYSIQNIEGKLEYSCQQNDTAQGDTWKISIRGFVRGDSIAQKAKFEEWARVKRFVVRCKDNTLLTRLAGNPNEFLDFSYKNDIGGNMGELRGYSFEFSGLMTYDPPIYSW